MGGGGGVGGGGEWILNKIVYGAGSSPSSYSLPFFIIRFRYNAPSDSLKKGALLDY